LKDYDFCDEHLEEGNKDEKKNENKQENKDKDDEEEEQQEEEQENTKEDKYMCPNPKLNQEIADFYVNDIVKLDKDNFKYFHKYWKESHQSFKIDNKKKQLV